MRCLSERGGPGKLRSYWEQRVHVAVGQTGNAPVFEVRPVGRTGKPRELHINLLLPFDFLQVDHPDPSANQSQGKVPSSSPRIVRERLQKDKFGTSDSVDEDNSSGLSLTGFETLQLCTPTGDTERRTEGKAEVTNETMTEDVATPHGTCFWGRRQKKNIATLSSRDSHRMCYCDQLGNPSYHPCSASSIQIATANSVPGQIMYCPPCPPWVIATPYYYGSPNLQWGPSQYGPFIHVLWRGTPILVSVDACSSLLRITLRQLLKKNLFSHQLACNWEENSVYYHLNIGSIGWGHAWNFLSSLITLRE